MAGGRLMADEKRKQRGVVKQTLEPYLLTPTAALNRPGACGINRARPASTLIHLPASRLKVNKFSPLPEFGHRIQQAVMPIITKAEDAFIPLRTEVEKIPVLDRIIATSVNCTLE
jgi:hypothetical protein